MRIDRSSADYSRALSEAARRTERGAAPRRSDKYAPLPSVPHRREAPPTLYLPRLNFIKLKEASEWKMEDF